MEIRRQRWQERQKQGYKIKKPITAGKIILWLFIGFVVLALLGNCIKQPGTATHNHIEEHKSQQAESKVSPDIMNFRYTKQSYPKLYRQWGDAAMEKINQLMPKAALHVAKESSCDRVENVDLSDSRSTPSDKIVFFVDCANKNRFFVSESDINSGVSITAEQDKEIDNMAAIKVCDEGIKANLQHPSTFDSHVMDTAVSVNQNGNIIVIRGFSAKNGIGMEIEYRARCTLNKDYNLNPKDIYIEQK